MDNGLKSIAHICTNFLVTLVYLSLLIGTLFLVRKLDIFDWAITEAAPVCPTNICNHFVITCAVKLCLVHVENKGYTYLQKCLVSFTK